MLRVKRNPLSLAPAPLGVAWRVKDTPKWEKEIRRHYKTAKRDFESPRNEKWEIRGGATFLSNLLLDPTWKKHWCIKHPKAVMRIVKTKGNQVWITYDYAPGPEWIVTRKQILNGEV
jgi:hypothetical protein